MITLRDLLAREPAVLIALTMGVVDAGIILAVTFGVPITTDEKVAVDGFLSALLSLAVFVVAGVLIRSQVAPVSRRGR